MGEFGNWFEKNSGYALHRMRFLPLAGCCKAAVPDGRWAYLPQTEGAERPFALYRCPLCGRLYAAGEQGFFLIENPLRYRIARRFAPTE